MILRFRCHRDEQRLLPEIHHNDYGDCDRLLYYSTPTPFKNLALPNIKVEGNPRMIVSSSDPNQLLFEYDTQRQ